MLSEALCSLGKFSENNEECDQGGHQVRSYECDEGAFSKLMDVVAIRLEKAVIKSY